MNLVIVESPAKAKTINKYLGSDYEVLASFGHVRDLPSKDGSVRPDDDFAMDWEVDAKGQKRLSDIVKAVKNAGRVILATDPDREGEAISWHVLEVLKARNAIKDKKVERVVFNAVTREAVLDAMKHPRALDAPLVEAYLARRALDYLVGFTLSPVLWRKLPGARSAGRVQSVALRLVCDRENEIETFRRREYWSIDVDLDTPRNDRFRARVVGVAGNKVGRLDIPAEEAARDIETALRGARFSVRSVEAKPTRRNPPPPFTTSTLQQEASRQLGLSANETMRIAQRLYEGVELDGETVGLITYMRTDGVQIAPEAIAAARAVIGEKFGATFVPEKPRTYTARAKNAQEAHEAIRPTDLRRLPEAVTRALDPAHSGLYALIWQRTIASQMASAEIERTVVEVAATGTGPAVDLRANGSVVRFPGFLALYQEGRDDEEDEDGARLPAVNVGEGLTERGIFCEQHFTEPPPRYTEATLIKRMEELGIGRPSTYAATLSVIRDRGYVRLEKKRLIPEDKGRLVTAFLEAFFVRYVEYDFTAALEDQLDRISNGDISWKEVLREFWRQFSADVDKTKELRVTDVLEALNNLLAPHIFPTRTDGGDPRACPSCGVGRLSLKLGKYGSFIGCSNYPECRYTRQLAVGGENGAEGAAGIEARALGTDPDSGKEITLRSGRFGPYLQLGEAEGEEKPKRAGIPKGWDPNTLDFEKALALIRLPREVGPHPESGKPIIASIGRYGPYVEHGGVFANLESADEVFTVGVNRAVTLIADKMAGGGKRGRRTPAALRELGAHPDDGKPVTVRDGRYGPYVNHGTLNATLPRGTSPDAVTLEEALGLLARKAEQGPPAKRGRTRGAAKAAGKTAEAGEAAPKKAPAKKKPAGKSKSKRGKAPPENDGE
ncbi:MAG: type I DNA topoisomerase [Bauldia sp.]